MQHGDRVIALAQGDYNWEENVDVRRTCSEPGGSRAARSSRE